MHSKAEHPLAPCSKRDRPPLEVQEYCRYSCLSTTINNSCNGYAIIAIGFLKKFRKFREKWLDNFKMACYDIPTITQLEASVSNLRGEEGVPGAIPGLTIRPEGHTE